MYVNDLATQRFAIANKLNAVTLESCSYIIVHAYIRPSIYHIIYARVYIISECQLTDYYSNNTSMICAFYGSSAHQLYRQQPVNLPYLPLTQYISCIAERHAAGQPTTVGLVMI